MSSNPYAALPRVDDVLDAAADLVAAHGRAAVRRTVRAALEHARSEIGRGGSAATTADVVRAVEADLGSVARPGPRRVLNVSGVIVHTNLGRAPLHPAAVRAVVDAAGYADVELDLGTGRRGRRGAHVDHLLVELTGAQDALVVNNCAAALVLVLAALAAGRTVVVSRGHLVEIGGSFRLPDIMAASTAVLHEVGTTNRTRAEDYRLGQDPALLLTVHPSNFTQDGFVAQPTLAAVAAVAAERGIPLVHDAGSGLIATPPEGPLSAEPGLVDALRAGADVVVASADKLLGGPQAGIVVGRRDLVQRCRQHPLARALRVDKLRLAALSATLLEHRAGRSGPVEAMLGAPDLPGRAARLAAAIDGVVGRSTTMIGGGCAPGVGVDSPVVRILHADPDRVMARLRGGAPPVIARVEDGAVVVDLRTVPPADDAVVEAALSAALAVEGGGAG